MTAAQLGADDTTQAEAAKAKIADAKLKMAHYKAALEVGDALWDQHRDRGSQRAAPEGSGRASPGHQPDSPDPAADRRPDQPARRPRRRAA